MNQPLTNEVIYGKRFRQLPPELMSIQGLNPYNAHDSQSRQTMFASHVSQALQVQCAMPRFDPTGIEPKYGEYTFKMQMPVDAYIRDCIQKYPPVLGNSSAEWINPLTTTIYEYPLGDGRRGFGVLNIEAHHCMHQYFGFRYKTTAAGKELRPGITVPAGTVFAQSPSINSEGDWMPGTECNVCVMTVPGVTEDGVIARRGKLAQMKVKAYGVKEVSWGKTTLPLNLYGDPNDWRDYKAFPDLGGIIREDGLLFALRTADPETAVVTQHRRALREMVDGDKPTYIETNAHNAKVISIEVFRGRRSNDSVTLGGMNNQFDQYYEKTIQYHQKILRFYNEAKRANGGPIYMSPELINMVKTAQELVDQYEGRTNHMYLMNDAPLDDCKVRIIYEYELTPTNGYKLTGYHGDKVVIVQVWDDEDMPIDQWGNRADFIQDPDGTNRRMNLGRIYQHDFKAAFREVGLNFVKMWQDKSPESTQRAWKYLLRFYEIISPKWADLARNRYDADPLQHLMRVERFVLKYKSLRIWMPVDNPISYYDAWLQIAKECPVPVGPVTYRAPGMPVKVTTIDPVLIAPMYLMLLEKIGNDWSAVASAKVQHFDIPAKVSSMDKNTNPGKQSACRITGEGEVRCLYSFTGGGEVVAELFDQNTNRMSHSLLTRTILSAALPTNINFVIDRKAHPRQGGRVNEYLTHTLECGGIKFSYGDYRDADTYSRPSTYQH